MGEIFGLLIQFGLIFVLLGVGVFIGGFRERLHIRHLDEREDAMKHIRVNNLRWVHHGATVQSASMLVGQAVIATDYFKTFVVWLKNLLGGEMKAPQTLMVRARREALLRVLEQADAMGADEVWNVRMYSSNILSQSGKKGGIAVEIMAVGTAIVRKAGAESVGAPDVQTTLQPA